MIVKQTVVFCCGFVAAVFAAVSYANGDVEGMAFCLCAVVTACIASLALDIKGDVAGVAERLDKSESALEELATRIARLESSVGCLRMGLFPRADDDGEEAKGE